MFNRLFFWRQSSRANHAAVLYEKIVAASRQPAFFSDLGIPDTPLGRFEVLSLHMILFLARAKDLNPEMRKVCQNLTDEFFLDIDSALRELGIGDIGVPRRMKKLARMFFGRAHSYGSAIEEGDAVRLSHALKRNIMPDRTDWPESRKLADYAIFTDRYLGSLTEEQLRLGNWSLIYTPPPDGGN